MNKTDITFTMGLNTSPAEQKLNELGNKVRAQNSIYENLFRNNVQGFSMVGGSYSGYMGANNYGVPSVQNLERSISTASNAMEKFARMLEQMAMSQGFLMYGKPYTPSSPIYQGYSSRVAGYLPNNTFPNNAWTNSAFASQPKTPERVFEDLIQRRRPQSSGVDFSQQSAYDTFMRMTNASAMYEMWQNTFSSSPLMLEAPEPIAIGAGGNKIFQKYNRFGQEVGAKASKSKTKEDISETASRLKDVVYENKKDNTEWTEKLFRLELVKTSLKAIHMLVQGIARAWKLGVNAISGANADVTKDTGFFSKDTIGALRANSDRTRAMIYAGLKAYGANAPFSASAFDIASANIDTQWSNAVSGKGVDKDYVIATERLKRLFGLDITSEALLTGARNGMGSTDILIDAMNKVDFEKFASLSNIEQGQIRGDLLKVLGAELTDALLSYSNIRPGESLLTRVISKGGSAWHSKDLNETVISSVDALAELNTSFTTLRNTLIEDFGPAFIHVTNGLVAVIDFINKLLSKGNGEKDAFGEVRNELSISANQKHYKDFKQDSSTDSGKLSLVTHPSSVNDIFNNLFVGSGKFKYAKNIEALKIRFEQEKLGNMLYEDNLDPNSSDPLVQMLAMTGGKKGLYKQLQENEPDVFTQYRELERFFTGNIEDEFEMMQAMQVLFRTRTMGNYFGKVFGKDGIFDFNAGMDILSYLFADKNFISPEEQSRYIQGFIQDIKESKWGKDYLKDISVSYEDKNGNGKIDFGEATLTVILKDQYGTTLTTSNFNGTVR